MLAAFQLKGAAFSVVSVMGSGSCFVSSPQLATNKAANAQINSLDISIIVPSVCLFLKFLC
jgi:hypothetical protein